MPQQFASNLRGRKCSSCGAFFKLKNDESLIRTRLIVWILPSEGREGSTASLSAIVFAFIPSETGTASANEG